jgi:thiol-disulfide isomerase/thioredoxin
MKLVNKYSAVGFILGAVISPLIIGGSLFFFIQKQLGDLNLQDTNFPPPEIPIQNTVNLDWNLRTPDGSAINLEEEHRDKVVFINFWATWCPPCIAEMPAIEKLYQKFRGQIGFACISNEPLEIITEFNKKKSYSFPIYQSQMELPEEFRTDVIPTTFIISRDRKVALKHVGGADWAHAKVAKFIEALMNRKSELTTAADPAKQGG